MAVTISVYTDRTFYTTEKSVSNPDSYDHTVAANGGFENANFSLKIAESEVDYWYGSALGKFIRVRNDVGDIIWEGMINLVDLVYGTVTVSLGPLTDVANKVKVAYQTVDYSIVYLPGTSEETAFSTNTSSQARYHTFEEIVSVSDANSTLAEAVRDNYLKQMAWPSVNQTVTLLSAQEPTVTVGCVGLQALLDAYYYTDNTAGSTDADTQIENVLAADINGIWQSFPDTSAIGSNTIQVPLYTDGDVKALEVIQGIVGYGDASGNRWLFGILENARPYYRAVGSGFYDIAYIHNPVDGTIYSADGNRLDPSAVRPGKWMYTTSVISLPSSPGASFFDNPYITFVERVQYSEPDGSLSIESGRFNTVQQQINRLGIGGLQ